MDLAEKGPFAQRVFHIILLEKEEVLENPQLLKKGESDNLSRDSRDSRDSEYDKTAFAITFFPPS